MKILSLLLLALLLASHVQSAAQTAKAHTQTTTQAKPVSHAAPAKPVMRPQPAPVAQPVKPQPAKPQPAAKATTDASVGMSYQSAPVDETSAMITVMIGFFFDQFKDVHIDEYVSEEGTYRNINIKLRPPPMENIFFSFDNKTNSLVFFLKGVGVDLDTDVDMLNGAIKGHIALKIDKFDMDLKSVPTKIGAEERMKIDYRFHIKDGDIQASITASEDPNAFPPEVSNEFMPLVGNLQTSFKIGATKMMDEALEYKTEELLNQYVEAMSTEYNIPKNYANRASAYMQFKSDALPLRFGSNKNVIVDFDTSASLVKNQGRIGERLQSYLKDVTQKSQSLIESERQLERTRSELKDNKHHVLIAPHLVSGVLSNIDNDIVSYKLEDQANLQKKVKEYFGNDVELECYNHENEYPQYRSKDDAIIGEQTIKCSLHPKGYNFDPLYEIDVKLNFNIHPKVDSDGKSLKAEFGSIQATSINTHDKRMEVQATLSDRMDMDTYKQFDPFGNDMILPFLMKNKQYNIESYHSQNIGKFAQMLRTPKLIDVTQLEDDLFKGNLLPSSFPLPVPPGHKFENAQVKIHPNGVFDVSGDLVQE